MTDNFSRNLAISGALHAMLAIIIFVRAVFIPGDPIEIRSAIRVDVVGLPQKMIEPPATLPPPAPPPEPASQAKPVAKPEPKPEPKPVKPDEPTVNLEKKKAEKAKELAKKQEEALRKAKAQAALDAISKEVSKEKSKQPGTMVAGNELSKGDSTTGLAAQDYEKYYREIQIKVQGQFNIPQWLAEADLDAKVHVWIDDRGFVIKKNFTKSSGNAVFDAKVLEALESSQPFPAPPRESQRRLATSGVVLGFPR